jgi:hypothetical protein
MSPPLACCSSAFTQHEFRWGIMHITTSSLLVINFHSTWVFFTHQIKACVLLRYHDVCFIAVSIMHYIFADSLWQWKHPTRACVFFSIVNSIFEFKHCHVLRRSLLYMTKSIKILDQKPVLWNLMDLGSTLLTFESIPNNKENSVSLVWSDSKLFVRPSVKRWFVPAEKR